MKNQLFATLLITLCVVTSKVTAQNDSTAAQNDSLKIAPPQVENVYKGLRQGEEYKKRFHQAAGAVEQLNDIIQDQNREIIDYARREVETSADLAKLNKKVQEQTREIQELKDKKTPWYRHPITFAALGFVGGAYLFSR